MAIPAIASAAGGSSAASSAAAAGAGSAAVNAGGRWIGTAITAAFNKRAAKRQQKYTEQNMAKAHEYDLATMEQQQRYARENYDIENARQDYLLANSKRIEVQALRDAGLNPALAGVGAGYQPPASQSISSPVGLASSAPQGAGTTGLHMDMGSPGLDYLQGKLLQTQIDNIEEQTRGKRIENDNSESQNATFADLSDLYGIPVHDTGSFNAVSLFQQGAQQFLNRKELEETAEMRRRQAEIWNNDPSMQEDWKQSVINQYKQLGEVNKKIEAETGKTLQEILNLKEGVHYTRQQIKESMSRVDKNTQDILVGIMQEAKMDEEIMTMQQQRILSQNMDYATILKKEAEANEIGDKEEAEFWHSVLMYRSHNYENIIPAGIYSTGNILSTALQFLQIGKNLRGIPKIGFVK